MTSAELKTFILVEISHRPIAFDNLVTKAAAKDQSPESAMRVQLEALVRSGEVRCFERAPRYVYQVRRAT